MLQEDNDNDRMPCEPNIQFVTDGDNYIDDFEEEFNKQSKSILFSIFFFIFL
jgi:hypothetical protein